MSVIARASSVLRRRVVWIPGTVVVALAVSYLAAYLYVGGEVPRGTTVRGVDVGGMTVAAAESELEEELGDATTKPVKVRLGGETYRIDPQSVDLTFDAAATARAAAERRSANPVRLVGQLVDPAEVQPVVRADRRKLAEELAGIAAEFDRPVREGSVRYKGLEPVTTLPRPGRRLDKSAAARRIMQSFPATRPLALPTDELEPKTTAAAVREVAANAAEQAVSAPVTLGTGEEQLPVSRKALAANTEFVAGESGKLRPEVDGAGLARDIGSKLEKLEKKPKNARFTVQDGNPRVVDSKAGRMVDRGELGAVVAAVLDKTDDRDVKAPVKKAKPKLTTAEAKDLGIEEKVSTFTTKHQCCQPRVTNIHRAADILDGALIKPGKTFSLNQGLGQRTREKGFLPAPMILNGRHVDSVGGGVSQIATTTFNAMFFAGLEDVYHKPHSYYISRYPLGREATISWQQPDLKFKNDSKNGILITTSYTDTSITVTMWGTKRYEIDATSPKKSNYREPETIRDKSADCVPESPGTGYDVTYSRIFKKNGEVIRTEDFHTAYLAPPKVVCVRDEKKKDKGAEGG